jgi:hypothetical protein
VKAVRNIIGLAVLMMAQVSYAQLKIGDNTQMNAGGLATFGYAGDYGNDGPSSHGLDFGFSGNVNGFYYNPNFISFSATPYYNQSRADSDYQSLTGASGISETTNFFTGSRYPGSVTYRYDANSTGTFGLAGQPDFTTHGNGQGLAIGWSALLPDMPTLSVNYAQGSGSGTLYGTDETTDSSNRLFNVRSTYTVEGFHLNGFYDRTTFSSEYPEFLTGSGNEVMDSSGQDFGFGANHNLPLKGSFFANFNHASASTDYQEDGGGSSSYSLNNESTGASFHPTAKLGLFVDQTYTDNLAGFLSQSETPSGGVAPVVNLGSGSHSFTFGGGANYQFTNYLSGQAQAIYYNQYFFGQSFTGTYISGSVNYAKRLLDMFSFSATVIESTNGQGSNALGFMGNVNYFRRYGKWATSANFSYAQNVQSVLITYTTSYYNYNANVHRRFGHGMQWGAGFGGSHSGLTNDAGSDSHSETFNTSFGTRRFNVSANYGQSYGLSVLGPGGLQPVGPTPGVENTILFNGKSWGGGISGTPFRRMVLSATFSRALSDTVANDVYSRSNTEVFNTQLQYHMRRIGLQAGYTKFIQGISAINGVPFNTSSYFVGISRWFDIF